MYLTEVSCNKIKQFLFEYKSRL